MFNFSSHFFIVLLPHLIWLIENNFITIATKGDATDFGDLTQARNGAAAAAGT